jgi:acetyl-CoA acetyltransferase family protein
MRDVYIAAAGRTATGKRDGMFRLIHPVHLMADVLKEVVMRAGIEAGQVEDVILGCVTPVGEQGANIGRTAAIHAGFPVTVPGVQINRMCGSSQQAIHFGTQAIASGDMEIVIAGGIEHMTRVPMGSDWPPDGIPNWPYEWVHQGISAEMMAEKWSLSRDALDDYGFRSHNRAIQATKEHRFEDQIIPIDVGSSEGGTIRLARIDEGIRFDVDRDSMRNLKPAFKEEGVVTAGNSSQISDGAAALVLASEGTVNANGLTPLARIVTRVVVGDDPVLMLSGVIPATFKALERAGLGIDDISVFEVNEAFASVVLAWAKETEADMNRVNINGGAIANGHPLGASGAKLMTTLVYELQRSGMRYGLQTMCIGHGMATATIVERV